MGFFARGHMYYIPIVHFERTSVHPRCCHILFTRKLLVKLLVIGNTLLVLGVIVQEGALGQAV